MTRQRCGRGFRSISNIDLGGKKSGRCITRARTKMSVIYHTYTFYVCMYVGSNDCTERKKKKYKNIFFYFLNVGKYSQRGIIHQDFD